MPLPQGPRRRAERVSRAVVRVAGDSGDGVQLLGQRLTRASALSGNDVATLPDFPAEIRAPAGTLAGVSGFQLQFADDEALTAGDAPDVLVALNPAALRRNLSDLPPGHTLLVDRDAFTPRALTRAGYERDPLGDDSLSAWRVHALALTALTLAAVRAEPAAAELGRPAARRCTNFFVLGLLSWLYQRPTEETHAFLETAYGASPALLAGNRAAYRAGWALGETLEVFDSSYEVAQAPLPAGRYRHVDGNYALALGLVAASQRCGLPLFLGSYPITPASDIHARLSALEHLGVRTFQAEDEIAAVGAALGAAYGGSCAVTATSGPGMALMTETLGLAVSLELPLVVVDVQRAGPSTGLPTKTEQTDLLQAVVGRPGEAPVPVVAARSPADCFHTALEAVRIATTYRTPVVLLSDAHLARGSEPWRVPAGDTLPDLRVALATEPNGPDDTFLPYARDPVTLARPWAVPGTPGLEHRIGGLEKSDGRGDVCHEPDNHDLMSRLRAAKVAGIARDLPPLVVDDPGGQARLLLLSWGSTYGAARSACARVRTTGDVAHVHLRHLAPLPADLGDVLRRYDRVVVPEENLGQLALLVRAAYLVDVVSYTAVRGQALGTAELTASLRTHLAELAETGERAR